MTAWESNISRARSRVTLFPKCGPKFHIMSNFCEPLLAALKDCVLLSDCVMKEGRLPSECIKHHIDELPEECRSLRLATFECKRGMVSLLPQLLPYHPSDVFLSRITFIFKLDMRKRFRGNSAGATAARIKQEGPSVQTTELSGTTDSA